MSPRGKNTPGRIGQEVTALMRERMARKMMKQVDLVRATGIEQSRLSKILYCKREMPIDDAYAISRALGMGVGDLVDEALDRLKTGTISSLPGSPVLAAARSASQPSSVKPESY
ncbi:MAG: helix-turn-helix transcriptional regulator [Propionibacteriaceae bacterium]|jgi:DNA-binding Xre family transcriptional regulator|nr:helix-turn-helix transcriptional regulator [Propionibacteriaceae bacterium]